MGYRLESDTVRKIAMELMGWDNARGCKIEHDCAIAYGIPVYYLY